MRDRLQDHRIAMPADANFVTLKLEVFWQAHGLGVPGPEELGDFRAAISMIYIKDIYQVDEQ